MSTQNWIKGFALVLSGGLVGSTPAADEMPVSLNELDPVVAENPIETDHVRVEPGQVAGIDQRAIGLRNGREDILLHIIMSVAGVNSIDEVIIQGDPPLTCRFPEGVHGDTATVALLVDGARRVSRLRPALHTPSGEPLFP